jgi:hypothetical protein
VVPAAQKVEVGVLQFKASLGKVSTRLSMNNENKHLKKFRSLQANNHIYSQLIFNTGAKDIQ